MKLRTLLAAVALGAPLLAVVPAAPALAGGGPLEVRTRVVEGHDFTVRGRIAPAGRPVLLQRRDGGRWRVIDRKRTGPKGRYSFVTGRRLKGCTYVDFRVVAPQRHRQPRVVQDWRQRVIAQRATVVVPAIARPGGRTSVDGYVVPGVPRRPVSLQRQVGGGRWTTVASARTGPLGAVTFTRVSVSSRVTAYRILAPAWHGLRHLTSRAGSVTPRAATPAPAATFEQVSTGLPAGMLGETPLSDDSGRYVAFAAKPQAENADITTDLYLVDRTAGTTSHVATADGHFLRLTSISRDGRYVAFDSGNPSVVPGDTNDQPDVFVYDRTTGDTTRQSVSDTEEQAEAGATSGTLLGTSGRFLTFWSTSSSLGSADGPALYVRDQLSGTTRQVRDGQPVAGVTDDARVSMAAPPDRAAPCDLNGETDATVTDLATGVTRQASPYADFGGERNEDFVLRASNAVASADGRFVAYTYDRADFRTDLYLTDLRTRVTRRVLAGIVQNGLDISADGSRIVLAGGPQGAGIVAVDWRQGRTWTVAAPGPTFAFRPGPSLSADGRDVFFASTRTDLVAGDADDAPDVYAAHLG